MSYTKILFWSKNNIFNFATQRKLFFSSFRIFVSAHVRVKHFFPLNLLTEKTIAPHPLTLQVKWMVSNNFYRSIFLTHFDWHIQINVIILLLICISFSLGIFWKWYSCGKSIGSFYISEPCSNRKCFWVGSRFQYNNEADVFFLENWWSPLCFENISNWPMDWNTKPTTFHEHGSLQSIWCWWTGNLDINSFTQSTSSIAFSIANNFNYTLITNKGSR